MSGACDGTMERTAAVPVVAGALLPSGVYAAPYLERLDSDSSGGDLSLLVRRGVGYAQPVWAQHPAPWRRAGHDGGAAYLGTCLLYTSDAADDLTRVDLGCR